MKVEQLIQWLKTQPQDLEVCVVEKSKRKVQSVCFDDPQVQSSRTKLCLILGVTNDPT